MIAEITHKTWWTLHLRVVCGEELNAEEQATYEAGLNCRLSIVNCQLL